MASERRGCACVLCGGLGHHPSSEQVKGLAKVRPVFRLEALSVWYRAQGPTCALRPRGALCRALSYNCCLDGARQAFHNTGC